MRNHSDRRSLLPLLGFAILASLALNASAEIIDRCIDDIAEAKSREAVKSKGGADHNQLANVDTPTRAGQAAFRHWIDTKGERSELAMAKTTIGGTYWYGWSMLLPEEFDFRGSPSIVMQLATYPSPRNGTFPCKANGPFLHIDGEGKLVFHLQHADDDKGSVCEKFPIADDVSKLRGRWIDFVMHARWSGDKDGFLRFWFRAGDDAYAQPIDYVGRTWWNDEDKGPYFKMGLYTGDPGWRGPAERTLYTDEYRLGDENSSFLEVAPPARVKTSVGLIGQSILHFPHRGQVKDNLFDYLTRWGGGDYELKFATASGAGMHSQIDGAADVAAAKLDFFVPCEGTKFPLEQDGVARTLKHLGEYVAAARQAGSKPVMFMPYAHRSWYGDSRFPPQKGDEALLGGPDRIIPAAIETYKNIARELKLDYIPVLEAHVLAHERLKGKNLDVYYADNVHMTPDGHFLNACVTHAILQDLRPEQIVYPGDPVGLKLAAESIEIARETIRRCRQEQQKPEPPRDKPADKRL